MRKRYFIFLLAILFGLKLAITSEWDTASVQPTFVKRSEAVRLILQSSQVAVPPAKSYGLYPDVVDGEWYVPYLMKALSLGMINAEPVSGMLYPHKFITRGEFLKMLTVAFGLPTHLDYSFSDVPAYAWYAQYAGVAEEYSLFADSAPHRLYPEYQLTHAEASQALAALFKGNPQLRPQPKKTAAPSESTGGKTVSTPSMIKQIFLSLVHSRQYNAEYHKLELVDRINEERLQVGLQPLRSNYYLELAAQRHAKDMAERGYFSHYAPEGVSYIDRIRAGGYLDTNPDSCQCTQQFALDEKLEAGPSHIIVGTQECDCHPIFSLGENLAKGQLTAEEAVQDWMNSPPHRANILRPEFEEIGVGLFDDLWVTAFGRLVFN